MPERAGTGERNGSGSGITDGMTSVIVVDTGAALDPRTERVREACALLSDAVGATPSLAELARATGTTSDALRRDFRRVLGVSPKQYADGLRVERLRAELRDGRDVTGAMYTAGYGSSSRLYEQSDARLGMTPASYGAGGSGATIAYTVTSSQLGALLVARTERGICRVALGDDPVGLEALVRDEFPAAVVTRDDDALAPVVAEVLRRIAGEEPAVELPLDVRGTAFQLRVWRELQRIPRGETRTYGALADAVGAPGGARAVGQACGSNPVAVVVPCHRVVPAGGGLGGKQGLGGYAWGVEKKRTLLDHEASS
jgi:AraC family transcriptional regulator of adaptative response/methylated-DNA-[protein]-cysteine methyltransferase